MNETLLLVVAALFLAFRVGWFRGQCDALLGHVLWLELRGGDWYGWDQYAHLMRSFPGTSDPSGRSRFTLLGEPEIAWFDNHGASLSNGHLPAVTVPADFVAGETTPAYRSRP